jgi:two-component system, OmpR family, response regulator ChvI
LHGKEALKEIRAKRQEKVETGNQEQSKKKYPSEYALLVVDDEPDITLSLKKGLEYNGFTIVDTFNDPLLALSSFKTDFYDLILLDVKMPKMNGFELYRELEKKESKEKDIKACFITAYEIYYESLKKEFPNLNVGCFITKPIEIEDLVRRINAELESR